MGDFDPERRAVVGARPSGAPRKLTPERRAEVLKLLEQWVSREDAAAHVGITSRTLRNEINRDPAFKADVRRAEGKAIITASRCVAKAARKDPKLALEVLARKRPKAWAKRPKTKPEAATVLRPELLQELLVKLGLGPPPAASVPLLEAAPISSPES